MSIINSNAEALVNTVNCEGVMGKGVALLFKNNFPDNYFYYRDACRKGQVRIGEMFVQQEKEKWIINFPTKTTWRLPSEYDYVKQGLISLSNTLHWINVNSIAIPALGCGNGGLDWKIVKPMILEMLENHPKIKATIYDPR